jgi:hypothetical protein
MPLTPEYYVKRAEEIEAAARNTSDPILRRAQEDLARALRALAEMIAKEENPTQTSHENGDNGLPKPN